MFGAIGLTVYSMQGIQFLIEAGFIPGNGPQDVAKFLLNTDGLSKAVIGEYLGEGCVSAAVFNL
jgi:brefeldin A-inhibited guanine nucleotide-exchange protein